MRTYTTLVRNFHVELVRSVTSHRWSVKWKITSNPHYIIGIVNHCLNTLGSFLFLWTTWQSLQRPELHDSFFQQRPDLHYLQVRDNIHILLRFFSCHTRLHDSPRYPTYHLHDSKSNEDLELDWKMSAALQCCHSYIQSFSVFYWFLFCPMCVSCFFPQYYTIGAKIWLSTLPVVRSNQWHLSSDS